MDTSSYLSSTRAPPLIMTTAAAALLDSGGGGGEGGSEDGGGFDSGDNQAVNAAWSTASSTTTAATQIASAIVNRTITKKTDGSQYFYQVEQLTFLWILLTMIVIGNATVLIALLMSKGRKSRMNFFIKNLAAADLSVGLVSVLTDIIWKITIAWEGGLVLCKLVSFLRAVVTYASTYVLVALSIDRYDAITHPMNFSGSWKRARGLVAAAWILSFIFSAPLLHFFDTKETKDYGTQCSIGTGWKQPWQWKVYMTLVALTLFIIPAVIIAGCYIHIVITIWNKGKDMTGSGVGGRSGGQQNRPLLGAVDSSGGLDSNGGVTTVTTAGGQVINVKKKVSQVDSVMSSCGGFSSSSEGHESRRASSRGLIPKAKVKTVKMTFVIIFVFILCWGPYFGFDLLQVYGFIDMKKRSNRAAATFIQSLAPLNSAANPLIYCLFSTNIGQQLCNLFGCRKAPANLSTGMTTSTHSTKPSNASSATFNSCSNNPTARRTVSTLAGPNNNGIGSGKAPVRATVSSGPSLMSAAPVSGRTSSNRNLFSKHNTVLEEEPSSPRLPLSCNGNGTKQMTHDTKEESKLEYLNLKV